MGGSRSADALARRQELDAARSFLLDLPGPIDIAGSLEIFRRNGDDLLDRWDGENLVRALPINGEVVSYVASSTGSTEKPQLQISVQKATHVEAVANALRSTFVAPPPEFGELLSADPVLARLDELFPGFRPVRQFDLLAAIVRCISAQQVNLRWATTTRRRLAETFGQKHVVAGEVVYSLKPERLASATVAEIRALQFTNRKAEYMIGAAQQIVAEGLDVPALQAMTDQEVVMDLVSMRGIGLWTAEWILARTLGRPRLVAGDLGIRKAVGQAYLGKALPLEDEVREAVAHWGPSTLVAQSLLLEGLGAGAL